MLQIKKLTLTHRKDLRMLLRDFDLVLNPGDKAVVIGEEGNGKSSLLKWIYDPRLIEDYMDWSGERTDTGEKLGYLPQELPAALRDESVYGYFSGLPGFFDCPPRELASLAARLSLPADVFYSDQRMGSLSGGEKVKLQMAGLLLQTPDVLLLDEPSNDIDIETLEWLETLIRDGREAVLYISHDEALIEATANRVILLEQLRRKTVPRYTVANMPFRRFMEERAAGFEKQAQVAAGERRDEKKALERFRRIQQSVEHAQNTVSRGDPHGGRLLKKKMASVKAMEKRYEREHESLTEFPEFESAIRVSFSDAAAIPRGKTVLEFALPELTSAGEDRRVLARNVDLTVRGPEKVCIIGRNGAGKTTLLRLIYGAFSGREDVSVFYMPQDHGELLDMEADPISYLAPSGEKEDVTRARTFLGSMKYTADEMAHPVSELSGGQRAKLLMLKMGFSGAGVLILDEPTRNFSPLSGPEIRQLIRGFPGAVIAISHDRKFIRESFDRVLRLTEAGLEPAEV